MFDGGGDGRTCGLDASGGGGATDDRRLSASSFAISATFSAVRSATYDRTLAESFGVSPVTSA